MKYEPTKAATSLDKEALPVMLNVTEHVAPILGISDKHGRDLCREGAIDGAVKVGTSWRVPRDRFLSQFGLA